MKALEIRTQSPYALPTLLQEKRVRVEELRLLHAQKKAKNLKELGTVKKDIARILTILRQQS